MVVVGWLARRGMPGTGRGGSVGGLFGFGGFFEGRGTGGGRTGVRVVVMMMGRG